MLHETNLQFALWWGESVPELMGDGSGISDRSVNRLSVQPQNLMSTHFKLCLAAEMAGTFQNLPWKYGERARERVLACLWLLRP